ncbi:hypothetical protein DFH05DRAFT_456948 [Lentinula detonsa]|uniref:Uncharacterized protein n=1 Tax=Lentinula detonsa TaxID=2804962 RepID=A0A9W8TTZ6_9AGAR|nr:hypothetical protein DFH05DRAFT_456948 [Lentinula detonsa]
MPDSSILSPVASRSARPLKRSASAASLPTPPRTNRRQKNRKLRTLKVIDEEERDEDGATSLDEEEESQGAKYKRRKISGVIEENEADEDAFWMAGSPTSKKGKTKESNVDESDSDSDTTTSFLSRRGQKSSTVGSAPVSPPPSHRRVPAAKIASVAPALKLKLLPVVEESPSPSGTSPPATPKSSKMPASRDTPNNPFLASPLDLDNAASGSKSPGSSLGPLKEKATMTYVFRGVKKTYANPYYDHENNKTRSPEPTSLLPPEHEDYTPDLRGAPRALWPRKKKGVPLPVPDSPTNRARRRKAPVRPTATLIDSDDELDDKGDDEEDVSLRPVRLFGPGGRHPGVTSRS